MERLWKYAKSSIKDYPRCQFNQKFKQTLNPMKLKVMEFENFSCAEIADQKKV